MDPQELFARNRAWARSVETERPGFFNSLVQQQSPKYMWIGCSDSRVPANQITGMEPGEVFVHRNVANLVVHADLNALSAIQYAVDVLKVRHIAVVGHYGCGGVLAAYRGLRVGLADHWIRHVRDVYERHQPALLSLDEARRVDALVDLNVIEQSVNLCRSTVIMDAWKAGQDIQVHGWAYALGNGLLRDLRVTIACADDIEARYRRAVNLALETQSTCAN